MSSFLDDMGRRVPGEEFDMPDAIALSRIREGLVVRVGEEPERAVRAPAETAVLLRRK